MLHINKNGWSPTILKLQNHFTLSLSLSVIEMASTTSSSFAFSKFDSTTLNPQYRRRTTFPNNYRRTHLPKINAPRRVPFSPLNLGGYRSVSCLASSLMDPSEERSLSDLRPTTQSPEVEVRTATWNWRGYRIRYQFAGNSGPALVLVHGFGANSDHWRKNLPFLARSHKVYSIDLIGYGYSDKPNPRDFHTNSFYTFETWGTQLNDFCVDVIRGEAFFICNSIGGVVGLQAATLKPQICEGIVILNISLRMLHIKKQPWYGRPFIKSFQSLLRNTAVGELFYKAVATPKSVRSILCQCYYDTSKVTDELVEKILLPGLEPGALDVFLDFICYSGGPLPEELLPQVKCPVLVGWGDKDPWEPIELGKAYEDFDSVEDFIVLPNVGHCPQDEAPDLVNPLVESFVARHTTTKVNADPVAI